MDTTMDDTRVIPLADLLDAPAPGEDNFDHLRWDAARIPMSHRFTTLAELTAIPADVMERAQSFFLDWHQHYLPENAPEDAYPADKNLLGQGMLLAGSWGHGKTSLACALAQAIAKEYKAGILFAPMADYVRALLISYSAREQANPLARKALAEAAIMLDRCANVELLILDDVGKEHITNSGVAKDEFDRLVRMRKRRALPTLITTNLSLEDWKAAYGGAMASFMFEAFPPVIVNAGRDLRRRWTP